MSISFDEDLGCLEISYEFDCDVNSVEICADGTVYICYRDEQTCFDDWDDLCYELGIDVDDALRLISKYSKYSGYIPDDPEFIQKLVDEVVDEVTKLSREFEAFDESE